MGSDTLYGDFMMKLIWRLSGNLIYHIFSIKIPDNLQTNFTIKSPMKVSLSTPYPHYIYTVSTKSSHNLQIISIQSPY